MLKTISSSSFFIFFLFSFPILYSIPICNIVHTNNIDKPIKKHNFTIIFAYRNYYKGNNINKGNIVFEIFIYHFSFFLFFKK